MSKEFECTYCGCTVKWAKEYVKGQGPLNLDGSKHDCRNPEVVVKPEPKTEPDRLTVTCPFNDHNPCKTSCALYLAG